MKKLPHLLLLAAAFLFFAACGEPEEENMIGSFDLVGKWDFVRVSGEGIIGAAPLEDADEDPEGFIEFYSDGHGFSDFNIELLGQSIGRPQTIQWEIRGDTIDIEEEDGARELWELQSSDSTNITAVWRLDFGALNNADITMQLAKE